MRIRLASVTSKQQQRNTLHCTAMCNVLHCSAETLGGWWIPCVPEWDELKVEKKPKNIFRHKLATSKGINQTRNLMIKRKFWKLKFWQKYQHDYYIVNFIFHFKFQRSLFVLCLKCHTSPTLLYGCVFQHALWPSQAVKDWSIEFSGTKLKDDIGDDDDNEWWVAFFQDGW